MTTRQQRRAAARKPVPPNGTGPANTLSPEQVEVLRQMLQPLVMQWRMAQAAVAGYLMGAHIQNVTYNINVANGTVTLLSPPAAGGPGLGNEESPVPA